MAFWVNLKYTCIGIYKDYDKTPRRFFQTSTLKSRFLGVGYSRIVVHIDFSLLLGHCFGSSDLPDDENSGLGFMVSGSRSGVSP